MGHCFMIMLVVIAVLTMNMDMGMDMRMFVGMDSIAMTMLVSMGVGMFMGVLQFNGVFDHEVSADDHHSQGNIELDCRSFAQKQQTEYHPEERGNGVVSARLCCSQFLLRHDVKIDAQAIGHKTQKQHTYHPKGRGNTLTNHQSNDKAA